MVKIPRAKKDRPRTFVYSIWGVAGILCIVLIVILIFVAFSIQSEFSSLFDFDIPTG